MSRQRDTNAQEKENQRGRQQAQEGRAEGVQAGLGLATPLILTDLRLAQPANLVRRAEEVRALQRQVGNATVQRMLRQIEALPDRGRPTIHHRLPADKVARDLATAITQAETRAGGPGGVWELSPDDRERILGLLQSRDRRVKRRAVAAIWTVLRTRLRLADRIRGQLTANLGVVDGERIGPASGSAMTLVYVPVTPSCAALRRRYEEEPVADRRDPAALRRHQQIHSHGPAAEMRFIIQVNPAIVGGDPNEALARLHSTLMHEYTHVEQTVDRGVHEGTTFKAVGRREFLCEMQVTAARPRVMLLEALDEIEATCSEIENAEHTGLADSFAMDHVLTYLWRHYESYHDRVRPRPGHRAALTNIARRVHRNILAGRAMLRTHLSRGRGRQTVRADLRARMLRSLGRPLNEARFPPPDYRPQKIDPFLPSSP